MLSTDREPASKSDLYPDILITLEGKQVVDDGEGGALATPAGSPAFCRQSR